MQTTNFNETPQGTIAVTYTDPYDLSSIAKMISSNHERVAVWKVIMFVGCPGNWVYGPVLVSFDLCTRTWFIGECSSVDRFDSAEARIAGQGYLSGTDQDRILAILRKAY